MPRVLERNLRALALSSPRTAEAVARAAPAPLDWSTGEDGALSASLHGRALGSLRRPLDEAERFAAPLDPESCGGAVVLGFGLGHHVAACTRRLSGAGVVLCFEPDTSLLRAVLERIDCADWLAAGGVGVLTDADDGSAVAQSMRGVEGLLSIGVRVLTHQPSVARLGDAGPRFADRVVTALRAMRTNVLTTLMQSEVTLRNLLMNADHYAQGLGVGELSGAARGMPALVVSAGPSLASSLAELAHRDVRSKAVVIAVQTALKPMLRRGIRPHYVVAIDYHEISRRFYDGLTARDVEGVTLIADPKCNPVILESFPGPIRTVFDPTLSRFLGGLDAHDRAALPPGATVAHLAYTLARHLGCDPVVLVGQDLAFAGGLYYGPGAAIHDVWSGELSEFGTLEALEWQRVARMRSHLRRVRDWRDAPVYTDEQMSAYRVQFEQMFAADAARGLTTIDTAPRGASKQGATPMPLRQALERWGSGAPCVLPQTPPVTPARALVGARAREVAGDARELVAIGEETLESLERMATLGSDAAAVDALVPVVQRLGERARALDPAYALAHFLNQAGALRRYRADRAIEIGDAPATRQQQQIARDLENVRWLRDAGRLLAELLDEAADAHAGGAKRTRTAEPESGRARAGEMRRIAAIVTADFDRGGCGAPRNLAAPVGTLNVLELTIARVAQASSVSHVVVLTESPELADRALRARPDGVRLEIRQSDGHPHGARRELVRRARAWSRECWRGGLGNATVWDEAYSAPVLSAAMHELRLDAALVLGGDWACVDPTLIDQIVARYLEAPSRQPFVFSPAAPGLAPVLLARELVDELARRECDAPLLASMAGLTGYLPAAPVVDPIAKSFCVTPEPALRDAHARCIADSPARVATLRRVLAGVGDAAAVPTSVLVAALRGRAELQHVVVELCTGRLTSGRRAAAFWRGDEPRQRGPIDAALVERVIERLAELAPDACLSLGGAGDPLLHPDWARVIGGAKRAGLLVHVRTDLVSDAEPEQVFDAGADVISVDLLAETPGVYSRIAGADYFGRVRQRVERAIHDRDANEKPVWIVPRITRLEPALGEIEPFYDRWLLGAGAAVIDPAPGDGDGECVPLPLPRGAHERLARTTLHVLADGLAASPLEGWRRPQPIADLRAVGLDEAWRRATRGWRRGEVSAQQGVA